MGNSGIGLRTCSLYYFEKLDSREKKGNSGLKGGRIKGVYFRKIWV